MIAVVAARNVYTGPYSKAELFKLTLEIRARGKTGESSAVANDASGKNGAVAQIFRDI